MSKGNDAVSGILAAIDSATGADLDSVDEAIAALDRKRESLAQVRKLIDIKLNGKPERKKPVRKAGAGGAAGSEVTLQRRRQLAVLLSKAAPLGRDVISQKIGVAPGAALHAVLSCEWFAVTGSGEYRLTELGRKENAL
jgi:hypothetical protein